MTVFEILLGLWLVVLALLPDVKFTEGKLGTKQVLPAIAPAWIGRLIFFMIGLGVILDGIWEIRRH